MMTTDPEQPIDTLTLARLFVEGRSIKRLELIEMVKELLAMVTNAPRHISATCSSQDIPAGIPNAEGYDNQPPIAVQQGIAGAVFLGPEANRYFTRSEAIALAGAIARTATK